MKIWKTIKLGTGLKTATDFCKEFKRRHIGLDNSWGNTLLHHPSFKVASKEIEVDLVRLDAGELCRYDRNEHGVILSNRIYPQAIARGLELCPIEVGPQLFIQHKKIEWLVIGMKPVTIPHFRNCTVDIMFQTNGYTGDKGSRGHKFLDACCHDTKRGHMVTGCTSFVFVLPRKK